MSVVKFMNPNRKSDNDFIQVRVGYKRLLQQAILGLRVKYSDNREVALDLGDLERVVDGMGT